MLNAVRNPHSISTTGLASAAFARHYLRYLGWFLFLALLRCFSSGGFPHIPMNSVYDVWTSPYGFLHSEICGSMDICSSPQLIAAYRVLRRLPVPRHSPCALLSLTMRYITYPSSELVMRESLLLHSTNIVVYPNILLFMGFTLLYLIRSFRCSIFKVRFEWVSSVL